MPFLINLIQSSKNQLKMIGYKYSGFVIKKKENNAKCTAWHVFKYDELFSVMAFSTPEVAKKIIDLYLPESRLDDLTPFNYTP